MNEEIKKAKAKLATIMDAINREQGISEELTARRYTLELDVKNLDVVIARKKEELEKVMLDLNNKQLDMKDLVDKISAINSNKIELDNEFESKKREVEYLKEEKEKIEKEIVERKENVEKKIKEIKENIIKVISNL